MTAARPGPAAYWRDLAGRATRTAIQTLLASVTSGAAAAAMTSGDWVVTLKTCAFAAIFSVLTSIVLPGPVGGRTTEDSPYVDGLPPHPIDGDELQQAIADEQYRRALQGRHRREP